ncbi:hypothetical protein HPB52_015698 [Rhipicephalus sanguineus]|uniref:Uncharacterized protein n=1 Tax=Rhipicephalus sanguineus TaxID=34632 RepID=A0A9D4PDD9_RHISA|nr:hypothetical protein HPB52_015698 [Rhipicephalus sanguineus]
MPCKERQGLPGTGLAPRRRGRASLGLAQAAAWSGGKTFVTWSRFLCVMALPVIAARPNTWGGSDYVAFLEDDHIGLLGSMRFPFDGASESNKSPGATSAESDDEDD